jgi:hypothetical protein
MTVTSSVYYLRLHLDRGSELNGLVEADLPFECFLLRKCQLPILANTCFLLEIGTVLLLVAAVGVRTLIDCFDNSRKKQERGQKANAS